MKLAAIILFHLLSITVAFTIGHYHGKASLTNIHNDLRLCDMPEEAMTISTDPDDPDVLECYQDIKGKDTVFELRFAPRNYFVSLKH